MDTQRPQPEAIGEYLTLHSQDVEQSVYEDKDGTPISVDNEYAYSQSENDIFGYDCFYFGNKC